MTVTVALACCGKGLHVRPPDDALSANQKAPLNLMLEGARISKAVAYYYSGDKADLVERKLTDSSRRAEGCGEG